MSDADEDLYHAASFARTDEEQEGHQGSRHDSGRKHKDRRRREEEEEEGEGEEDEEDEGEEDEDDDDEDEGVSRGGKRQKVSLYLS